MGDDLEDEHVGMTSLWRPGEEGRDKREGGQDTMQVVLQRRRNGLVIMGIMLLFEIGYVQAMGMGFQLTDGMIDTEMGPLLSLC